MTCALMVVGAQAGTAKTSNADSANSTLAATSGEGETFTHKEGGLQFEVPKGWKAEPDGDQLTVSSPDNSINMVFWVPEEDTFAAATEAVMTELGKVVKNAKVVEPGKEDTHNGMSHYSVTGTGDIEGHNIFWSVDLLAAKKPVIILSMLVPEKFEQYAADAKQLIKSIKKVS